jgi:S-adenosylmethionine uptake transporter
VNRVLQHPVKAFAVALTAVASLSLMDAVMKGLVIAIGIFAVLAWRALVTLILSAAFYLPFRDRWPSRTTLWIHISRSVLVSVMAFLFFWGIARVPLAQGIALTFIAPLIALLLAAALLHEKIGRRSIAGSIIAFAGVLVIVIGQASGKLGGAALTGTAAILGSALCYAGNIVMMRQQALAAKPLEINFFQSVVIAAIWAAAVAVYGPPHWPAGRWVWIIVAASLSTAGSLLFAWAYARAEASYLAVTEYSAFIWASILGWLVFREPLSPETLAGAALIVGGCILASRGRPAAAPEIEIAA